MTRRGFLGEIAALAAAAGMPAQVVGAAAKMEKPDLVLGLLSDIHLQLPPRGKPSTVTRFRHALEYFRDRHVDGVLISGDLADAGLEVELKAVADTWFEVFPDGKLPDGSPVANLMFYGDHDTEKRFYSPKLKAIYAKAGLSVPRSLSEGELRKELWEKYFHEPWAPLRHVKVKGYDFILSNFMREGSRSAPEDLADRLAALNLDPAKPFFYGQHRWIRGTYLSEEGMSHCGDNKVAFGVLSRYPNAVAFQGHTHYMLTDPRSLWIGDFISVNNGSLYTQSTASFRENGVHYSWVKDSPMLDTQMKGLDSSNGHAGMVMSLKGDVMVLERRDFKRNCSLGPDLVCSIDPAKRAENRDAARAVRSCAPAFPETAHATVCRRGGQDRRGRNVDQVVVSFPVANPQGKRPRALDYVVRAFGKDGVLIKEKRVYSQGINLPPEMDSRGECAFAISELVPGEVQFTVAPANCWRVEGAALSCSVMV